MAALSIAVSRSAHGRLLHLQDASQLLGLALEGGPPAHGVDRSMLGGAHQPGRRTVRDAGVGPLAERGLQRVMGQILGQADIPDDPGQCRDDPG